MSEQPDRANPKPPSVDRLSQLWRRVNDHKIVQWSIAYVALAYGIQHGVVLTAEAFIWPHAIQEISMLALAFGLPLVMTFAWYHGERASRRISGPELTIISLLLVISSLMFYVFVRPSEQVAGIKPAVQQASVAAARTAAAAQAGAISIAVLPFVNLSGDAGQEFFSDGMTEEITSALAKVPDLRVVGRTSAFQFKGEKKDLRAIGQALNATHLIEGSVRKDGNQLRITAQLIKAEDGTHVWTENYDRELKGVFSVQEEIASAIAGALRVPLGLKPGENLVSNRGIDPESYDQYLRARALLRARNRGRPLTDTTTLLEQVVARNPDFAPALALFAQAYDLTPNYDPAWNSGSVGELRRVVDASLPRAEAAARRAIELDPTNADGYVSLGFARALRGKLLLAEDLFKQSLALDPNNPDALHQYGNLLAEMGRLNEALAMRQRLQALEPFVPVFNSNTARVMWENGQNDAAIAMFKAVPSDDANRAVGLARVYAAMGRYGESADALLATPSGTYPPGMVDAAAHLLRTAPAKAAAPQTLPRLGVQLDFVYLHVGAPSRVLDLYERDVEAAYSLDTLHAQLWHPSYAPVRKTERFKAFARKTGLVDYWRERGWPDLCRSVGTDDFVCD